MSPTKAFFGGLVIILTLSLFLGIASCLTLGGGALNNATQVVKKEFYPDALLKKYEWFKDASAALDAKAASLGVYESRFSALAQAYEGAPRSKWSREDREQSNIWLSEATGIKLSYNNLAAEYNAEMVKFNWRFTNTGDVPEGGRPLPRSYRPYIEQ